MKYLQITQFLYLGAALFSFYMAWNVWTKDTDEKWIYLCLGIFCIILFIVRRRFIVREQQRRRP